MNALVYVCDFLLFSLFGLLIFRGASMWCFLLQDRRGLESNVLRFLGRMVTAKPIDQSRRFIISYFLSDDTILVFEPPVRNSGTVPTQDLPYLLYYYLLFHGP